MRKKLLLIVPLALIIATGAYALVANLFPNMVSFPRIPMGSGSLGQVLGQILGVTDLTNPGDGTVGNTLALSGVSASNYLQNGTCTNGTDVWLSIDAGGKPVCGTKGAPLAFGILTDTGAAGVTITHPDNSTIPGYIGLALNVGDIVSTPTGGSASIGFTSDNSIIRLDQGTVLELQSGNLDGKTVAQAILDNGNLWGRVLTSTGINFGAGGYIAGVRGTSIAMSYTSGSTSASIIIPHSTHLADAVTVTHPQNLQWQATPFTGGVGTNFTNLYVTPIVTSPIYGQTATTSDLYSTSPLASWITLNTKKDIIYLNDIVNSGATQTQKDTASGELAVTLPHRQEADCTALIAGNSITLKNDATGVGERVIVSTEHISGDIKNDVCGHNITPNTVRCGVQSLFWWTDLNECGPRALAYADYTKGTNFYSSTSPAASFSASGGSVTSGTSGALITTTGNYIAYDVDALSGAINGLSGKTVTIELDGPLVLPAPTQDTNGIVHYTLRYLFDGGSSQVRYWAVNGKCTPPSTTEGTGKKICQSIETITSVSSILISRVIALPISVAPSQFIIGAQLTSDQTNPYKNQISNTIRKITIK